ncbi:uncharacterized protein LOC126578056 [Anopheles aquasalis]|uniref:uncharacterized protein LOC126578056 n=1 Tax=Anopheles aquasalis TaxID=42839 RepID=UPI00215B0BFF|nr:uncharacterized protein LOC126578056 [Anopheles aquasalis]
MYFDPLLYVDFLEAEKLDDIRKEFAENGRNVDSSGESSDEETSKKSVAHLEKVEKQQLNGYVRQTLALYHFDQFMKNIVPQEQEPETLVNSLLKMSVAEGSQMSRSCGTPPGFPPVSENVSTALQDNTTNLIPPNCKITPQIAAKEESSTSSGRSMTPRRPKRSLRSQNEPPQTECAFCRNNGEPRKVYQSHILRDQNKAVVCPKLRALKCMNCNATGAKAHTLKYCPYKKIVTPEDLVHMEDTLWKNHHLRLRN